MALPPTNPAGLVRDAEDLNKVINGDGTTNRAGDSLPSIKAVFERINDDFDAMQSGELTAQAVGAADRAEDAYNAIIDSGALQSASLYETIADGLAGVADDEYFWVYPNSLNSIDNLTLFKRVDAMTEELLFVQYNLNEYMIEEGSIWETE